MDTAERLIRSTRELPWERGYVGTSPKAIQQRAQAGQGSMYRHFSGKPDLALAAIRRSAEQVRAEAEVVLSGPGSPAARIGAYLVRERDVLRGCPIGGQGGYVPARTAGSAEPAAGAIEGLRTLLQMEQTSTPHNC